MSAAILRLVHFDDAVKPVKEPSTFDQAWALREGMMRKRGDGREKTRKLWDRAAKIVGQAGLLEAFKRFLRETKEPTCGHPGLSVWLNGQRYDHWLDDPAKPDTRQSRQVAPESLRGQILSALGEPFVLSYLDPCIFHEDGYITPRTSYALEKLKEKAAILKAAGIAGIRRKNLEERRPYD